MEEPNDTTTDKAHEDVRCKTDREEVSEVCEPCIFDNITQPAVGWCETCYDLLCDECYKIHCRPTITRNHQLRSLGEMRSIRKISEIAFKCQKHEGKSLKYFCKDHTELGCSQCFTCIHRACSKVVCIAEVSTAESDELKALELLLCKLEKRMNSIDEKIERNVSIAERQHDEAIAGIQEAGEKLKSLIDTLVKEQIAKADKAKADNISNIHVVRKTNKEMANTLITARDILAAEKSDNNRLFITMKHLHEETKGLESKLYDSEQKSDIKGYKFVLNPELAHLLETVAESGLIGYNGTVSDVPEVAHLLGTLTELGTLTDKTDVLMDKATDEVVEEFEVKRFQVRTWDFWIDGTYSEAIQMSTDRGIRLLYVLLYPCNSGGTEGVLSIKEGNACLISCNITHEETDEDVVAVKVIGDDGVHGLTLQAGHRYDVAVTITGGWSCYGVKGLAEVSVQGVKFTFRNSNLSDNTTVVAGRIPGLRFALLKRNSTRTNVPMASTTYT